MQVLHSNITKNKMSQLTKHTENILKVMEDKANDRANFNNLETNPNNNVKIINIAKNCSNVQALISSDVPGKKILLYEDKNVPLTMIIIIIKTYNCTRNTFNRKCIF